MSVYSFRKTGAAPSTDSGTVMYLSIIAAAGRMVRLVETSFNGQGTASAVNEFIVTPGTTGGGALTSVASFPLNPMSTAASGFTSGTTWATSVPTFNAQSGLSIACNSNGGVYRWLAKTNFELFASAANVNYGTLDWSCQQAGAAKVGFHTLVEEL
jgi:hypothetical protein